MPRTGLSPEAVVTAAIDVLDERGLDGLTLAAVAERAGVAAPSLYKHVDSLGELRSRVAARLLADLTERLRTAVIGRSGDDAVIALMRSYRAYVLEHPQRYAAVPPDPLHDPALSTVGARLLDVVVAVLRSYDLDEADAIHVVRCLRAAVHGFASIEASGGFGLSENVDETYDRLIRMFLDTLPNRPRT
ncbi:MAG TPA: TetR/AcrR family transcriptional regulator [Micromonosporaceae bacterium]